MPGTLAHSSKFFRPNSSSTSHPARHFNGFGKSVVIGATAGVAGAGTLLAAGTHNIYCHLFYSPFPGGYALYHLSGMRQAVDTFRPAVDFLGQAKVQLDKHSAPSQVLGYLRQAAKNYVAFLPGTGWLVDKCFDTISQTVDTHAEEANAILNKAYMDILKVVMKGGNEHRVGSAIDILAIIRTLLKDMKGLGIKAGQPISQELEIEKHAATVSTAATSVLVAIKSRGPAVQKSLSDFSEKVVTVMKFIDVLS